jgi:hypothetical protein
VGDRATDACADFVDTAVEDAERSGEHGANIRESATEAQGTEKTFSFGRNLIASPCLRGCVAVWPCTKTVEVLSLRELG